MKYDEAISRLSDLVETNPRVAAAYNLLGYSYRKRGDFDRAERNYARALRLDPDHKACSSMSASCISRPAGARW